MYGQIIQVQYSQYCRVQFRCVFTDVIFKTKLPLNMFLSQQKRAAVRASAILCDCRICTCSSSRARRYPRRRGEREGRAAMSATPRLCHPLHHPWPSRLLSGGRWPCPVETSSKTCGNLCVRYLFICRVYKKLPAIFKPV